MAVKLFEHPLSPYARKAKVALYEKGIPFDRLQLDPGQVGNDSVYQEFVLTSPRREVPALVDGEVRIAGSTVILEYLDERWPQRTLLPKSASERCRVRMLEEMMDTEYEAVNWGIGEIKIFGRATGGEADALLTRAAVQLQRLWNRLDRELDGREFMNGERFGRGDLAVYPHVRGSEMFGFSVAEHHPRLGHWLNECASRESIRKEAEELSAFLSELPSDVGAEAATRVRQYRDHRLEWMMKTGGTEIVLEGLEQGTIRFAGEYE